MASLSTALHNSFLHIFYLKGFCQMCGHAGYETSFCIFPFSRYLVHFQKMLSNRILQKHHLIRWISMALQIISAKKTTLAKLLHLLTGFIGEIRDQISIYIYLYTLYKQDIRNPLSLLAHERSCFAACVHFISTLHFSSFFDHKFTTFTTNLTLLYNTRQNDWCPGKPVKQALPGYTRPDKNRLPLSRGEC